MRRAMPDSMLANGSPREDSPMPQVPLSRRSRMIHLISTSNEDSPASIGPFGSYHRPSRSTTPGRQGTEAAHASPPTIFTRSGRASRSNSGLVHRQRATVGVERAGDPERQRRQMLSVPERQPVQHRHPEGPESVFEDLFDRLDAWQAGLEIRPFRLRDLSDHDADDAFELSGRCELVEHAVDV